MDFASHWVGFEDLIVLSFHYSMGLQSRLIFKKVKNLKKNEIDNNNNYFSNKKLLTILSENDAQVLDSVFNMI